MELTKAEKGERKLVKDGYIYVFKKVLASDKVRANVFCEEKLAMSHNSPNLSTDEFTEKVNNHTHAPSPTQVEVIKVKVGMKSKAKTTEETVQPQS